MVWNKWSVAVLLAAVCVFNSCTNAMSLQNEFLLVHLDEQTHSLTISDKLSARTFVHDFEIIGVSDSAEISSIQDTMFGRGQQLSFDDGREKAVQLHLFPGLPFVLVKVKIRNSDSKPLVLQSFELGTINVDWGVPASDFVSFGTGGLLPVSKNPGSYAWLALVEPRSRQGIVTGWITHDRGSGILFSRESESQAQLIPRLDFGRLAIAPGEEVTLDSLALGFFADARLGLEAWADVVAQVYKIQLPPQPTGYCTWYSKPHGGASDEDHLKELAQFAAMNLAPHGFSVVQIDDKWQAGESNNGPRRNFTTHSLDGPYPSGMKSAATSLTELGLTPGIWFMPFAGTYYDPFFADKQDWFVKRMDGKPYETSWGGTCLDMTHPHAREYLRTIVDQIAHGWGYSYFKIDGLWTGTGTPQAYVNSGYRDDGMGDAKFYDPNKTNIEAYRDGLKIIRQAAGPEVFILGCNAPQNMRSYAAAMGLVDAMRVGPDNGPSWKKLLRGPTFGSRHYFLHGRVWYNDPDPVYVRESLPLHHAQMVCSWVAISGQLNVCSEWIPGLPPERLDILKRSMPSHTAVARPVDLFEHDPPRIWEISEPSNQGSKSIAAFFNWDDKAQSISCPFSRLGLDEEGEYAAFDYWGNNLQLSLQNELTMNVPAQSCRILSMIREIDHPAVISTSRHVTQGLIDLLSEEWNQEFSSLYGKSRVVGGEDYELRILLPASSWQVEQIRCRIGENQVGLESISQEDRLIRIRIEIPTDGIVNWSITFADPSEDLELSKKSEPTMSRAK